MADSGSNAPERQHDFDIQKDVHRKIRNDPDYDDWEYGTEPLPHENWKRSTGSDDAASAATPTDWIPPSAATALSRAVRFAASNRPAAAG